jgi:stage II sporulation protein M
VGYRKWLLVSALIFVAGILLGLLSPDLLQALLGPSLGSLKDIASSYAPFTFSTFVFIFFRNASSLIVSFILSPLLCIVPVVSLFVNGWLLGYVGNLAIAKAGVLFLILGILPHGIFELPAFFIGEAAALSAGVAIIRSIFSAEQREGLGDNLKKNVLRLLIAIVLLLPAALIETYITPLLIK